LNLTVTYDEFGNYTWSNTVLEQSSPLNVPFNYTIVDSAFACGSATSNTPVAPSASDAF